MIKVIKMALKINKIIKVIKMTSEIENMMKIIKMASKIDKNEKKSNKNCRKIGQYDKK